MIKSLNRKPFTSTPIVLTALLHLLLGLSACQQEAETSGPPPVPEVEVITVVPRTLPDEPEFIGQTEAFRPVEIRSQVTGIIKSVLFTEGRNVEKGDRLYLIDPVPFKAAYLSAKAKVTQAQARLVQAKRDLARVKPLYKRKPSVKRMSMMRWRKNWPPKPSWKPPKEI